MTYCIDFCRFRQEKNNINMNMISRLLAIVLFCCSAVSAASEDLPKDSRSLFNHGAELAASGKLDEATEVLRQVAVVRDKSIAAKALTLLGQISAASARQLISENPAETPPEQRQTIFDHLKSAEHSFDESLSLLPNNEVRQYLETLRAWRHNITNVWEEYDREQRRNAELQQRIQWLTDWEEKLTETVRPITEEPDSPRKFQTGYETGGEQKQLAEELAMLQKIQVNDEELEEKWKYLPEIQKIASEAAELLSRNRTEEALPKQQRVVDYLRTLLKKEQNQQDQQNQEQNNQEQQEQQNQDQQQQDQNQQSQPNESKDKGEQKQEMNQPQSAQQENEAAQKRDEDAKEKAERLLLQVRRKEQAAEKRRELLKAQQMQAEPVEKDW